MILLPMLDKVSQPSNSLVAGWRSTLTKRESSSGLTLVRLGLEIFCRSMTH